MPTFVCRDIATGWQFQCKNDQTFLEAARDAGYRYNTAGEVGDDYTSYLYGGSIDNQDSYNLGDEAVSANFFLLAHAYPLSNCVFTSNAHQLYLEFVEDPLNFVPPVEM